jgi:hypothetical protein
VCEQFAPGSSPGIILAERVYASLLNQYRGNYQPIPVKKHLVRNEACKVWRFVLKAAHSLRSGARSLAELGLVVITGVQVDLLCNT